MRFVVSIVTGMILYIGSYAYLAYANGYTTAGLRFVGDKKIGAEYATGIRLVEVPRFMLINNWQDREIPHDKPESITVIISRIGLLYYPLFLMDRPRLKEDAVFMAM